MSNDDDDNGTKIPGSFIDTTKANVKNLLASLDKIVLADRGIRLDTDVIDNTPGRVGRMMGEILSGYAEDPFEHVKVFETKTDEMVISKGIDFYSLCEHHMLPFFGHIHIGYIPDGKVLGVSKLARIALVFAKRMQLQERLTNQIADFLYETEARKKLDTPGKIMENAMSEAFGRGSLVKLGFGGVMVVIEAIHLCEVMRGVKMAHTRMVTSAVRGAFKDNPQTRSEFLSLIHNDDDI